MLWDLFQIFWIAALPVIELRGAIPYGLFVLDLPVLPNGIAAVLGNIIPILVLLPFLDKIVPWIFKKNKWAKKHLEKHFQKLHYKHSKRFNRVGYIALVTFVSIPFPGTGVWTGSALAYIFHLPKKQSFWAMVTGLFGAATIVTILSGGIALVLF